MEIGKIEVLIEVSLISTHLVPPREIHLEQVLCIYGFLRIHNKMRLMFDCSYPQIISKFFKEYNRFDLYMDANEDFPPYIPESRGHKVSISMFVDFYLAEGKSARCSQTGVLIFIHKDPTHWYSNRQATV